MPDFYLLPKQMQFVESTAPETMYSGAVRASKTVALCVNTYMRASRVGAREILCRKTLPALKGTTLKTLLEGDGLFPPVIPKGTYTHNKQEKEIKLHDGGEILYLSLVSDGAEGLAQRTGSYSGTGVNIDEATELDENDYRMLLSRASLSVPGVPKRVSMACNPGSPSHFLAKRFAPPGSGISNPVRGCVCISTKTHENTFLDPDYLANLDRDKGTLWYRRFVEGLWCGAEGLVYDKWDRELHVRARNAKDFKRWYIGIDDGYTNPFVVLLAGVDDDGRVHIFREFYQSGLLMASRVAAVREIALGLSIESVTVDPSSPDLIAELGAAGFFVLPADNEVVAGINRVQGRLAVAGDGKPRLTAEPSCENFIREKETYQWKPNKPKDEPVKAHDHAMDAERYMVGSIDITSGAALSVASPGTPDESQRSAVMAERLWQTF